MRQILTATALALAAQGANAQSQVTLYGKVDASLTHARWTDGTTGTNYQGSRVDGGNQVRLDSNTGAGGNRLGIRVTEQLPAGLKAIAVMENGFSTDTGAITNNGTFWGRQIFVGLQGSSWSLTAGRQYSPMDLVETALDAQANMFWGQIGGSVVGLSVSQIGTSASGTQGGITRADNSILWTSNHGPWKLQMMAALGNENEARSGQMINPGLYWQQGPVLLAASYARYRQASDNAADSCYPQWQSMWVAGGSYDFKWIKAYAGVSHIERAQASSYTSSAQTAWNSMYGYWLGASLPMGQTGRLSVTAAGNRYKNRAAPNGHAWQLGGVYEYFLSKRTELYLSAGLRNNDRNAQSSLSSTLQSASTATGYGMDYRTVTVGMTHSF